MRILILGVSGMLGNTLMRFLSQDPSLDVYGTVRSSKALNYFAPRVQAKIIAQIDALDLANIGRICQDLKPQLMINCIGLIKQLAVAEDPLTAIPINTLLPHQLAKICQERGMRLIHISTDCVFFGTKGNYQEKDFADANDLYGRSKYLGELHYPHTITLRTSIIGHELHTQHSLINWFLSQELEVQGYKEAIFSGLPTVELARVIKDFVLVQKQRQGLYHVAATPINKYDLLQLVAKVYGKTIKIIANSKVKIDRSLDASRFQGDFAYQAPDWLTLIQAMHNFK